MEDLGGSVGSFWLHTGLAIRLCDLVLGSTKSHKILCDALFYIVKKNKNYNLLKMGLNLFFGVFWGCSGGGNIEKIHRGIDPDEKKSFQKIDFLKI